ncbi:TIR domain-containing protein [Nocardia asteroides]|nr:TIR domain-containing protein [Nocardia asteroides]
MVREVRAHLPEHVNTWIDEKDLLAGDPLERQIRSGIESDCDFLVVFLDESVVRSDWVAKELLWARDEEVRLGRPFVLPVLIDDVDLGDLNWLRERVFLRCYGFTEADITRLASELASSLFAWLSRDVERLRKPPEPGLNDLAVFQQADKLLDVTAAQIRSVVLPHRKTNPMRLSMLYDRLVSTGQISLSDPSDLNDLLFRMGERKLLSGISITGGKIYVEEEHLSWRLQDAMAAKQAMADYATDLIEDGQTLFIDGGSTALQVAKNVCKNIRFQAWHSLVIVTNSPPVAAEFAVLANELGLEDFDSRLQLYIVGGRMRMNAATIVNLPENDSEITKIADSVGGFDIAFCGTNGIHWPGGCTTTAETQARGKNLALLNARRRIVAADSSKYGVRQEQVFATFDMNLEIVTAQDGHRDRVDEIRERIADTGSKITIVG